MNVLIVAEHAKPISGPHRNVVGCLNALAGRSDVHVRLLTGQIDEAQPYCRSRNVDIIQGFEAKNRAKILHNLRLLRSASSGRDLVYVPTGLHSFLLAYVGKRGAKLVAGPNVAGIPFVMRVEHPSPLMTDRMSARWITMSPVWREQLLRSGSRPDTLDLIPHSVDCAAFNPRFRDPEVWLRHGLRSTSRKIVFTGHVDKERKGARHIVKAHQSLVADGWDVELILIGRGGDQYEGLRDVHRLGFIDGQMLSQYVASADLFVGASRWETFWFAPLEAMASGVPVLVTSVGAVPSMVPVDGDGGFLLDIIRPDGRYRDDAPGIIARRIAEALSDPERLRNVGAAARERAVSEFSIQQLGDRLVACFQKAIATN